MRPLLASLALAGALLAAPAAATAGDAPAAPTATAQPGQSQKPAEPKYIAVVKVDVTETIDGQPSKENLSSYFIRKKLREAGYNAWSAKPIHADDVEKRNAEKAAKKADPNAPKADPGAATPPGAPPAAAPKDEKPEPDLFVKGYVALEQSRASVFYGQQVAFSFQGKAKLEIVDKTGQVVAKLEDEDEWGATTQDTAKNQELKRIALFASSDVLKAEPIRSRLTDKGKAQVDAYVASLESQRHVVKHGEGGSEDGK